MTPFVMPSLGADMVSGKLMQWLVAPGDEVKRGDVVAVIETDKGAIDVEIFEDATFERLLVSEGTDVPVGAPMAMLAGAGSGSVDTVPSTPTLPVVAPLEPAVALPLAVVPGNGHRRIHASPLARRRAQELGIDLELVRGTRPDGAICAGDVERAAAQAPAPVTAPPQVSPTAAEPAPVATVAESPPVPTEAETRQGSMRAAIAAAMSKANREIPHYYLRTDIDMSRALGWLAEANAARPLPDRLIYATLLIKAVAKALDRVPEMNGFYTERGFEGSNAAHIGVAISLRQGGLVAPAIHNADLLSLDEIMAAMRDLIARARGGKLKSSEVMDPTITVTNLGEQGVPEVYGVIYPPQVALVGFGKIVERPWVVDGLIGVRPIMTATLAADHRASDGHRGGIFLAEIDRLLQKPEEL